MFIDIPDHPFSPWLRLAHRASWGASPATGSGTRRHLRDWKFLLQLSGDSWLWYEAVGGRWPLRPGDLALVPPGQTYAWGVPQGAHLAVHFDLHAQPGLSDQDMVVYTGGPVEAGRLRSCPLLSLAMGGSRHLCRAVAHPPSPRRWQERLAPLVAMYARREHATPAARLAAAGILAECMAEWLQLARPAPPRDAAARAAVAGMIDALPEVPAMDLDVPGLARRVGLGETAFRAAFRKVAGASPRAWLERRRIDHAARLLRDGGCTVADAAAAAGYADPFHFARVFRRVRGCAPSDWAAVSRRPPPASGRVR